MRLRNSAGRSEAPVPLKVPRPAWHSRGGPRLEPTSAGGDVVGCRGRCRIALASVGGVDVIVQAFRRSGVQNRPA
jgi:hypothetical protein